MVIMPENGKFRKIYLLILIFPSIKAITDVLDKYAVPNLAATVSLGHLNALPSSFLFIAKTGGGVFTSANQTEVDNNFRKTGS